MTVSDNSGGGNNRETVYTLLYRNGSQTLMTEAHFNKIIFKRKNDPFWQEVMAVYTIPFPRESPITFQNFDYVRNANTEKEMVKIMEKVIREVDSYEEIIDKDDQSSRMQNVSMMAGDSFVSSGNQPHNLSTTLNTYPMEISASSALKNQSKVFRPRSAYVNPEQVFK